MANQIELAQNRLFGVDGLRTTDIKLFPGSSRDVSKEQFAEQINKALAQLEADEYELVDDLQD